MAMVEMQTTAALAESRRKMQARRRLKNRIALTLSMATMAFGLFWLIWILMSTITRGIDGMSLALFTEMTPPPNTEGGGLANALAGSGLLILWATVFGTPLGNFKQPVEKSHSYLFVSKKQVVVRCNLFGFYHNDSHHAFFNPRIVVHTIAFYRCARKL